LENILTCGFFSENKLKNILPRTIFNDYLLQKYKKDCGSVATKIIKIENDASNDPNW
jgi:hypothetical protein